MRLGELPDWSNLTELSGLELYTLRDAKLSRLRHFIILEMEYQGSHQSRMLKVEAYRIEKVLSVLKAHIRKSLREIAGLTIDD